MADIFQEVEEEVRKDRLSQLWQRYGILVWLLAVGIVIAVAANEYRQHRRALSQVEQIERFEAALAALQASDYQAAADGLDAIVQAGTRLSPLAAHYLAQVRLTSEGDTAAAVEALGAISDANGDAFEKLALLKLAYLRADEISLDELRAMMGPLSQEPTAMGALAAELIAVKLQQDGQVAQARQAFNRLRFAANAPAGLVQRATIALDALPAETSAESTNEPSGEAETPASTEETE